MRRVWGTIVLLLATGSATAQQRWVEIDDDRRFVPSLGASVGELVGLPLHDTTGERVGEIDGILLSTDGRTMGVALDVGGWLGVGEREVVVPLSRLTPGPGRLETSLSKRALQALPRMDDWPCSAHRTSRTDRCGRPADGVGP